MQAIPITPTPTRPYRWDERCAVTPGYYFIATLGRTGTRIWQLPRNEIDKPVELLPRLRDAKGSPVLFPEICGVTDQWLYLNAEVRGREFGETDKVTMRLNLSTGKLENLREGNWTEGYGWYNAGTDSILYYTSSDPYGDYDYKRIEALDLATGKRSVIFDEPGYMILHSIYRWYNLTDGRVALREMGYSEPPLYAVVDAENRAVPAKREDLPLALPWEAECNTTVGNRVFWVEKTDDGDALWRMNLDGTGKTLLRADTHIRALQGVGGCLFAKVFLRNEWVHQAGFYNFVRIERLGFDGQAVGTVTETMERGEDSPAYPPEQTVFLEDFGGKLLVARNESNLFAEFVALYDPETGKAFLNEDYY